jgi:chemotaxis protein MotA
MDKSTTLGFFGGIAVVTFAVLYEGSPFIYISMHALIIVFGGGFCAVLYATPMDVFLGSWKAMGTAFKHHPFDHNKLILHMSEMAAIARKDGLMALEGKEHPHKFVQRGAQMLIDGADEYTLAAHLRDELAAMKARHALKQESIKAWVELGPAYGMVGTLIGLVAMMGNMSDPKLVAKGMATALLGTLYGAIVANTFFGPMAGKLKNNTAREMAYCELAIEALRGIARADTPRNITDKLTSRLPTSQREAVLAAA